MSASNFDVPRWCAMSTQERNALLEHFEVNLRGEPLVVSQRDDFSDAGPRLISAKHNLEFWLAPGGSMKMGIQPEELDFIDLLLGHKPHIVSMLRPIIEASSPVCEVEVAPFLCSRLLEAEEILRYVPSAETDPLGAVPRLTALEVARAAGARLPSDAELEWIARQGAASPFVLDVVYEAPEEDPKNVMIVDQPMVPRFGIGDLFEAQWAADDWFPNHEGRPKTAAARTGGDPQGLRRFEEFDFECVGKEAVISQLSAMRHPGRSWRARVRLVLDLPAPELLSSQLISL